MFVTLAAGLLALTLATSDTAPSCVPGPDPLVRDFAQVFIGQDGTANDYAAYLSLVSPAFPQEVWIIVWPEGRAGFVFRVKLEPGVRTSVKLNDRPPLRDFTGAVSVRVHLEHDAVVGVGVHSTRDFWTRPIVP